MLRSSLLALGVLLFQIGCAAQELTRAEVLPLFEQLGKEDWSAAIKTSGALIKAHPTDTSDLMGVVNYASILSAAAMVSEGKWKYAKLDKHMRGFVGKRVWMAAHPTTTDTNKVAFNTNVLRSHDGPTTATVTSTNRNNTRIFCFERYAFDEVLDIDRLNGSNTRIGGILDSFMINPNGSVMWILRLQFIHAIIREA